VGLLYNNGYDDTHFSSLEWNRKIHFAVHFEQFSLHNLLSLHNLFNGGIQAMATRAG